MTIDSLYDFIIGIEFMGSSIVVKDGNSFKNRNAGRGNNREYRGNRQNRRYGGPRFNRGNNYNQNFQQQQPLKMEQYPCRYNFKISDLGCKILILQIVYIFLK